jgi:hypothetical protein
MKNALIMAIENKKVETMAKAIFAPWFCKSGIPAEIHTDRDKEFANKLSNKLSLLINVEHSEMSPAHP